MEKRLIVFHESRYLDELSAANSDLSLYNKLLSDLRPYLLKLSINVNIEFVAALLKNPKECAFDNLIGGNPITISGIPVNKQKAIEMIDMPDDWGSIVNIASTFNSNISEKHAAKLKQYSIHGQLQYPNIGLEAFDLDDEKFILKSAFIEGIKSKNSVHTQSDEQNKVLDIVLQIYNGFKKLKEMKVCAVPSLDAIGIHLQEGLKETHVSYNPQGIVSRVK